MMTMTPVPANFVIAIREEPLMKFAMPSMVNVSASLDLVGNFVIHAWMDFTIILHVTVHVTARLLDPVNLHVQKMANAVAMPPMVNVSASLDFVGNIVTTGAWMDFTIILHVTVHVTASFLDPMGLHVRKMANAVARITTLETNVNNVHLDITIILNVKVS